MSALLNISVAASLEKNRLSSDYPWFCLVDITWTNGEHLRLVRNTEDIEYDARDGNGVQPYTAFAWEFDELQQATDGSIPQWGVRCSNVRRLLETKLKEYKGGVGGKLAIYVLNAKRLKREPSLELYFDIIKTKSDANWCYFTLGAPSPFRLLHPRHTYTANRCIWTYKSVQCGYAGALPSCSLRLDGNNGCRAHNNQKRFGAFPGIDSNGVMAVTER